MSPSAILDIALAAFALLIVLKFTIEGFISSILDTCKALLSIFIAYLMRIAIARLFCALFMKKAMVALVHKSLELSLNPNIDKLGIDIVSLQTETPEFFEKFLTKFGLDYSKYYQDFIAFFENDDHSVMDSLANNVGGALAMLLATVLAIFAVMVVAYIALSIAVHFLLKLTKFEGIKTANRWLGAALGLVIAFFVLWGCSIVIQLIAPALPSYVGDSFINDSMIIGVFEHISPMGLIKKIIYS